MSCVFWNNLLTQFPKRWCLALSNSSAPVSVLDIDRFSARAVASGYPASDGAGGAPERLWEEPVEPVAVLGPQRLAAELEEQLASRLEELDLAGADVVPGTERGVVEARHEVGDAHDDGGNVVHVGRFIEDCTGLITPFPFP